MVNYHLKGRNQVMETLYLALVKDRHSEIEPKISWFSTYFLEKCKCFKKFQWKIPNRIHFTGK